MNPAAFIKEIAGPRRRPLYVLSGGEPSAVAKCLAAAAGAVESGFGDFNFQQLSLEAGQAGRLIGEASTRPFFKPPRVVVTKNPPFGVDDWNALADYLEAPNPESSLVLAMDKPDARLRFFKKTKAEKLEVDCRSPKGTALAKWLAEEFKSRGVAASPQVCGLVIERAGGDLNVLLGEAEKLSLFLGEGGTLEASLVRALVSPAPDANIFELGEALGRHDLKTALSTLLELLATEDHRPVLAMMTRHFRLLLQIKIRQAGLGQSRLGPEEAGRLGLHPFVLEKTQGQAAAWPWPEVTRALAALEEAHLALVTTSAPPQAVLENLALKLGRPSAGARS